jgi:acetyltransferase-like isoleucine patch superfamily enzyme
MAAHLVGKARSLLGFLQGDPKRALRRAWATFWMALAGLRFAQRPSSWLAGLAVPPYYGRHQLARLHRHGNAAPSAKIHHPALHRGIHTSIADRVVVYQDSGGGPVSLGDKCTINQDTCLQTGQGGRIDIGQGTHIQPRCQFSAYIGSISIGEGVSVAPNCAFYPYNHRAEIGQPIRGQGLESRGNIEIEDDVWIGTGVIVLAGVRIGEGSVVAAGSVVTRTFRQLQ